MDYGVEGTRVPKLKEAAKMPHERKQRTAVIERIENLGSPQSP